MRYFRVLLGLIFISYSGLTFADDALPDVPVADSVPTLPKPEMPEAPPTPPAIQAQAYLLVDMDSGKILLQQEANVKRPPASLTKMMTLYIAFTALKSGQITMDTEVPISEEAWRMGGSKMFVKVGDHVKMSDLLQGIIVDSGNDACVATAEYLGGNEGTFASMMNTQAQRLGMKNSHFTDSTGLPNADHYTTPQDLAILARALIKNFPEYYPLFKEKWFTYAGIRQPNRNRLLWRDAAVDGIKTGHTDEAGFCLVTSAKEDQRRLIAVVMHAPTDSARASDNEALLRFGFRFFETHTLYHAGESLATLRVWKGQTESVSVTLTSDLVVTIPTQQYHNIKIHQEIPKDLEAPIKKGQVIGKVVVTLGKDTIATRPLVALESDPEGSFFSKTADSVKLMMKHTFGN